MYGIANASRCWYLRVKEELIKLGANVSSVDPGLIYWKGHYKLVGILACHVDDMIWGGNENFKDNVIDNLKDTSMFDSEGTKTFTYLGIQLIQNDDFSFTINKNNYTDCISEIKISNERLKEKNSPLSNEEKMSYRSVVGQLNWVAGISRPDISFPVCEASTKFKQATVADVLYVNKIVKNVKNSKNEIRFPQLNLNNIKLQLFTDASFNNLPNRGSQAGQIIFFTDDKSNNAHFIGIFQNQKSSKINDSSGDIVSFRRM